MSLIGREVVIAGAVRTPVGRGHKEKGVFKDIHPADLLGRAYLGLVERTGIDPKLVDNAIAGCVYQVGEQATGITRNAWLQKGLPETTGATTVDIRCGSGQQAFHFAAASIATGQDDVVVAAGVEHMGRVGFPVTAATQKDYGSGQTAELLEHWKLVPQGEGAELIADQYGITRDEMDAFALASHQRAAAATESGAFAREILPVETADGTITADQGIRANSTLESLGGLKPVFRPDGGRVTAGNSSQISDGAAALLLTSADKAKELGLTPRARVIDQVVLGVDPITMLTGPIPSTRRILERNGLTIEEIDVIEINEAFASVGLAWMREFGADPAKVNPRGGAIALGHPLGATGARLLTTLLHELEDVGGRYGLVTMCCGGGLGTATLIERI